MKNEIVSIPPEFFIHFFHFNSKHKIHFQDQSKFILDLSRIKIETASFEHQYKTNHKIAYFLLHIYILGIASEFAWSTSIQVKIY